jgi:hypothetical protein
VAIGAVRFEWYLPFGTYRLLPNQNKVLIKKIAFSILKEQ